MLSFQWPWMLLVLPLPWLMRRLLPAVETPTQSALKVPFLQELYQLRQAETSLTRQGVQLVSILAVLAWGFLIVSAMRPQWLGELVEIPVSGRDLMLAIDLSGSMEERDFMLNGKRIDRLTATKYVASDFIERRVGDRIGLVLFGEQPYLQAPLTFDRKTVQTLLDESVIGLAGKATAIGDAIGLAVKRLRNKEDNDRILILLTDGANTAGNVMPLEAARLASSEGLKIYTIGIGADEMLVRSLFGTRRVNPSADLDEKTLTEIAESTGGRYFRARDLQELNSIYSLLDELEPIEKDVQRFRPRKALFYWPLSVSLFLTGLILIMRYRQGEL